MTTHTKYSLARPGVSKILDPMLAITTLEATLAKRFVLG
jgi:hypothetical protein